jgi:hypothetical protein
MNGRVWYTITLAALVLIETAISAVAASTGETKAANRAAIRITNSGIRVEPAKPAQGLTEFTVSNATNRSRGVVVSTTDPGRTPVFRYSGMVSPGSSTKIKFWLYPGRAYHFKDYTKTWTTGSERRFASRYRSVVRMPSVSGFGRGPSPDKSFSTVTLTDNRMTFTGIADKATKIKVINNSNKARGVALSGRDRSNNPVLHYSRMLRPGEKTTMNVWLYQGRSYTLRDYTYRTVVPGEGTAFQSQFTKDFTVEPRSASTK